jgi:4-hydroxy-3-methylbut-2-enyl diphosphate reductase
MTEGGLLVLAPLRIECRAVRKGAPDASVLRTGAGPRRASDAAALASGRPARAVAVLGFCGALDPSLEPGSVVVADELRGANGAFACDCAEAVANALQSAGISARRGPLVSVKRIVRGQQRRELAASGAIAVDMESAWLAGAAAGRPFAALRAVVDTPSHELLRPGTLVSGIKAYRALGRAAGALSSWFESLPTEEAQWPYR